MIPNVVAAHMSVAIGDVVHHHSVTCTIVARSLHALEAAERSRMAGRLQVDVEAHGAVHIRGQLLVHVALPPCAQAILRAAPCCAQGEPRSWSPRSTIERGKMAIFPRWGPSMGVTSGAHLAPLKMDTEAAEACLWRSG
jgi:hypothetical protein